MKSIQELINHLSLEEIAAHTYRGDSATVGSPNVFGGQVLAQAIHAAYRTIANNRILNSMHCYFLEPGDLKHPIDYQVGIIRDGGSFSTRRVTAKQNGLTIFILACSFHRKEEGHVHQFEMDADVKQPEELLSWNDISSQYGDFIPKKLKAFLDIPRPVEIKPVRTLNPIGAIDEAPFTHVWFRLKGSVDDLSLSMKQQILTYVSDYNILSVMFFPNASKAHWGNTITASLDHSMWYFRDFEFDDWMLYSIDSPNASNARGFCRGNIFTRDGKLVASVAQEGLMRPKS